MEPAVPFVPAEFWGIKVGPKEAVVVGKETSEDDQFLHTYHLSQVRTARPSSAGRTHRATAASTMWRSCTAHHALQLFQHAHDRNCI
jgi:hypothetical protein